MPRKRTGKLKDKWKEKTWVKVETPPSFSSSILAQIPIDAPENGIGRILETTLFELMRQDPQQYTIRLNFQIVKIEGEKASTILKSQEFTREYLKSLIRRGSSMVDTIRDYKTNDGYEVRIYVVCFTAFKVNSSKKHAIRAAIKKILDEKTSVQTYDALMQEAIFGKMAMDLQNGAKKFAQIRFVGVRKIKLLNLHEQSNEPSLQQNEQAEPLLPPA